MKIPHAAKLFCVILDVTILNHAACIPVPHQRCYMYYNAAILMYLRVPPFGGGTGTSFTVRDKNRALQNFLGRGRREAPAASNLIFPFTRFK